MSVTKISALTNNVLILTYTAKVTFRVYKDGQVHELHGAVDKDRSHQNVLLVRTPSLSQLQCHFGNQKVMAQVIVTTGRSQLASNPLDFTYIPDRKYYILTQIAHPTHTHTRVF